MIHAVPSVSYFGLWKRNANQKEDIVLEYNLFFSEYMQSWSLKIPLVLQEGRVFLGGFFCKNSVIQWESVYRIVNLLYDISRVISKMCHRRRLRFSLVDSVIS